MSDYFLNEEEYEEEERGKGKTKYLFMLKFVYARECVRLKLDWIYVWWQVTLDIRGG